MTKMERGENEGKTCLVMHHDLLGFGNLISASAGTLDSAVGRIAYQRIVNLRNVYNALKNNFPVNTHMIHFNDSVCAVIDVECNIKPSVTDPSSFQDYLISTETFSIIIDFLSSAATLHQKIIHSEEDGKLGPGGRTIVVMGKRWDIVEDDVDSNGVQFLQANLAFSEAYLADSLGSQVGLNNRCYYNLYINDYLWHSLRFAQYDPSRVHELAVNRLQQFGVSGLPFPENLRSPDIAPSTLTLFHRKRQFFSLMSHHVCNLAL